MKTNRLEKLRELAIRGATKGERTAARRAMENLPGVRKRWLTVDSTSPRVREGLADEGPLRRSAPLWYSDAFATRDGALDDSRAFAEAMGREERLDRLSLVPWLAYEIDGQPMMLEFGDEAESATPGEARR